MNRTIETLTWGGKRLAFRDVAKTNDENTPLEIILEAGTRGGVLVYREDVVRLRDMLDEIIGDRPKPYSARDAVRALKPGTQFRAKGVAPADVYMRLEDGRYLNLTKGRGKSWPISIMDETFQFEVI